MPQLPTDIHQLFVYLGTPAFIGFVLSWVAAHVAYFNSDKVTPQARMVILFVLATLLGAGSKLLINYVPEGAYSTLQPLWDVVMQALTIILASQVYYHRVIVPGVRAKNLIAGTALLKGVSTATSFPTLDRG